MSANVDAMVRAGAEAYRNGNKTDARTLLEKAIELDQYNEQAWLWLSAVVDTTEEQRTCLENVLIINPNNERALMGLRSLGIDPGVPARRPATSDASPAFDDPTSDASPPSTPAFDFGDGVDDLFADVQSDSFDDVIATSSASAEYTGPTYSSQDYDNWMDNLNIGQSAPQSAPPIPDTSGVFGDADIFDEDAFASDNFDEDAFASSDAFSGASASTFTDDISTADDVEVGFDASFAQDFDDSDDYQTAVEDSMFDDEDIFATEGDFYIPDEDASQATSTTDQDYFQYIPKEIDVTRLPGEDEDRPRIWMALALILVVLNLGAITLITLQLTG